MTNSSIKHEIILHWRSIRERTMELLDFIKNSDLSKTLPFPESESLENQFYCMIGTQESWKSKFETGKLTGWKCSLDNGEGITIEKIKQHMIDADQLFTMLIENIDLDTIYGDKTTPLRQYMELVEHEAIHQGHLINFAYCHHLTIPKSWSKWGLS